MGLAERFELVRLIGQGGMGSVYEAVNRATGRRVALKQMSPEILGNAEAVQRFMQEARAASAIDHPNVVEVLDVGLDGNAPFLVMEFLSGEPFDAFLAREGMLDARRFVYVMGGALGALAAAHQAGIVHRDLKPANIFLSRVPGNREPQAKLLDFGIAKSTTTDLSLTRTGAVMGTPYYMSPEQAAGRKGIDARSDVYSLGVMLFQGLTGRLPFDGDNYNALIVAILTDEAPSPRVFAPSIPPAVEEVVRRAMAKRPEDRYRSVRELVQAIAAATGDPEVVEWARLPDGVAHAETVLPGPMIHTSPTPFAWERGATLPPPAVPIAAIGKKRRSSFLYGGAAVMALALIGAGTGLALSTSATPTAQPRGHTVTPPASGQAPIHPSEMRVPPPRPVVEAAPKIQREEIIPEAPEASLPDAGVPEVAEVVKRGKGRGSRTTVTLPEPEKAKEPEREKEPEKAKDKGKSHRSGDLDSSEF